MITLKPDAYIKHLSFPSYKKLLHRSYFQRFFAGIMVPVPASHLAAIPPPQKKMTAGSASELRYLPSPLAASVEKLRASYRMAEIALQLNTVT